MSVVVNPYNFLRWDDLGNGPADATSGIATGYMRSPNRCSYLPVIKHGEAMRFFINTEKGLGFVADTNIKLQLVNAVTGTVQNANVTSLQVCNFTNPAGVSTFTYYAEVTLANTVPEGQYYFVIKGDTKAWLQSNAVYVVNATNPILTATSLAEFRHDTWFYGIRYNDLSTFTHQYRLHINLLEDQEESSVDVFTEVTTGKKRTYNTVLDLIKTVETYYFDAEAHKAAIIMFKHSQFYLNGKQYTAKDAYKQQPDATTKLTKGSITLYDQEFASINRCS
jgi:hypothetical protein